MRSTRDLIAASLLGLGIASLACSQGEITRVGAVPHAGFDGVWQVVTPPRSLRQAGGQPPPVLSGSGGGSPGPQTDSRGADPMGKCLPPGIPRIFLQPMPFRIEQSPGLVTMIFEWNHLDRLIYLDTDHFEAVSRAYLGQSVAVWKGKTLVVDTTDFNAATWLDDSGLAHSGALHVMEQYSLVAGNNSLEDRITIEDAKMFTAPWETVLHFQRRTTPVKDDDYCLGRIGKEPMNLQ